MSKRVRRWGLGSFVILFAFAAAQLPAALAARTTPKRTQPTRTAPVHAAQPQDDVREVENAHRQYQQAIEEINQLNPFSQDYRPDSVPTQPSGTGTPAGGKNGPADQLRALLANPAVKGYLKFFQSPAFAEGAQSIAQSGNRKTLIWVEVIWFLLMFLSRSRSLSQVSTSSWGRVMWINLSHMVLLWVGALIAIPWVLFGEPYRKVIWGFFGVLFGA